MPGTVLLPLDGTPTALGALPTALGVARLLDARLALAQVFDTPVAELSGPAGLIGVADTARARRAEIDAALRRAADRARLLGVPATQAVLEGRDIGDALLAHAGDVNASLVVMATHARGTIGRAWHGSVGDRMVRGSGLPVVLVPPNATPTEPVDPARAEPRPLTHAVVPLDGSAPARHVLDVLLGHPALRGLELTLVEAVVPASVGGLVPPEVMLEATALQEQERHASAAMHEAAARLAAAGVRANVHVVTSTDPAGAIVEAARARGADLIAMTTRGHGGLRRLALGSTADVVLRHAHVPVLLVTPPSA